MNNFSGISSLIIGVDVGGTHITSALIDLNTQSTVADTKVRFEVDPAAGAEEILEIWVRAIKSVIKKAFSHSNKIGIAMPGPFDYSAGICLIKNMHKYDSLYGLNIKKILSEKLQIPDLNIEFRNDAEAFLHGEVFCGAAKGCSRSFGVTLGTGLGTAFSINGITSDANLGISAFYNGIAEDYISTRWFLKRYYELSGKDIKDVKTLSKIAAKDEHAQKVFEEFGYNLGQFIGNVVKAHQPQMVVIGGNIAKAYALFWRYLQKAIINQGVSVEIKRTKLGEDASLIGAVCAWEESKATSFFKNSAINP